MMLRQVFGGLLILAIMTTAAHALSAEQEEAARKRSLIDSQGDKTNGGGGSGGGGGGGGTPPKHLTYPPIIVPSEEKPVSPEGTGGSFDALQNLQDQIETPDLSVNPELRSASEDVVLVASPALSEPPPLVTKGFPVHGETVDQLVAGILANGWDASVDSTQPTATFGLMQTRNGVVAFGVEADVPLTVTYPEWKDYGTAKKCLRDQWLGYQQGLRIHESEHIASRQDYERRLRKAIAAIPPQPTVNALKLEIARIEKALWDQMNLENQAFDYLEGMITNASSPLVECTDDQ